MALGSTTCRVQRHGVGTGGERGTERLGERTGSTGEAEQTRNGERGVGWRQGGKRRGEEKR